MNQQTQVIFDKMLALLERMAPWKPLRHSRIWEPDESCLPFLLEACVIDAVIPRNAMIGFSVPQQHMAVIASITSYFDSAGSILKSVGGLQLSKIRTSGVLAPGALTVTDLGQIALHGNLANVVQSGGAAPFVDTPGIMQFPPLGATVGRPCRIPLTSGDYTLTANGALGTASHYLSLFGWTYPEESEK